MPRIEPAYLQAHRSGLLRGKVMSQYRPCGRAHEVAGLETALSPAEYRRALEAAVEEGITRLDRPYRALRRE